MEFEFLSDFSKRMHSVGRFALLMNNSFQKDTWKKYDIESVDEQMNIMFSILLYIMEMSLREENCTIDDISEFVGRINDLYFKRHYTYEDAKGLADFCVNTILCNNGQLMQFKGFDYEYNAYKEMNISFVHSKVIYITDGIRRTTYKLTDDGYNMILSTLELENNLKLTVHEMLFKMHLEKADYKSAVTDIKNVFEQLRIQYQKIEEAMIRIRRNALSYSVEEYDSLVGENIDTLESSREKFKAHRLVVETRAKEYMQNLLNDNEFDEKDRESMGNLKIIEKYLSKALDEEQRIMNEHFDLKTLYDRELENYANMTMIQRFHFNTEIYERIINDSRLIDSMEKIFSPLYYKKPKKYYNVNFACEYQSKIKDRETDEDNIEIGFDAEEYSREQMRIKREKLKKYEILVEYILDKLILEKEVKLSNICNEKYDFIPNLEIFREVLIEFLSEENIDIEALKNEREQFLNDESFDFVLNKMILELLEQRDIKQQIKFIECRKLSDDKNVIFKGIKDESGNMRNLRCPDICISLR